MKSGISRPPVAFRLAGGIILALVAAGCSPSVVDLPAKTAETFTPSPEATTNSKLAHRSDDTRNDDTRNDDARDDDARDDESKGEESGESLTPRPAFFEGRDRVTYGEFIAELRKIADHLARDPDVEAAHQRLLSEKDLTAEEMPLESFSRARLAFESARDSGLWGIRGTVTDQMPWSDRVWEQWATRSFSPEAPLGTAETPAFPTAVAECDEMGALFAILARDLGVIGFVGLHWPYWNHVVPVWQIDKKDGTFVRIVVPATQTFLDEKDTMGTTGLKTNRVVFPYVRKDRKDDTEMSADLARYLLTQSAQHGGSSTEELTSKRLWHRWNHRPGAPEQEIKKTPLRASPAQETAATKPARNDP